MYTQCTMEGDLAFASLYSLLSAHGKAHTQPQVMYCNRSERMAMPYLERSSRATVRLNAKISKHYIRLKSVIEAT